MDAEQESRWAAAQAIGVGVDLVPAALRHLEFLAAVDRRRWLYDGPLLHRAVRRYKACWLPLLAKHTEAAVVADDEPLVVPLDCEWIWHCHRLNPTRYIKDCKRLYGRILDSNNVRSSIQAKSKDRSEKVWTELYPGEPFELEYSGSPSDDSVYVGDETAGGISYDLISAVKRQSTFVYQVGTPSMHDRRFLEDALARYKGFLYLIKMNQEKGMNLFRVPTYDVDLMWHTHQLNSVAYCNDMLNLLGRVLEHDDTDDDRAEGKKLDTGFSGTTEQFENSFGVRYWKAGAMYRGSLPSPVTSIPQIFSSEDDGVFGLHKGEKHLTILETTIVELYVQIVDIKNLPSAIPEKSVYVWFTKTKPDAFIRDGGRLDISSKTGKSVGAGFQCEPTGEIILTVMVDQACFGASSSSKKSEPLGKVSIYLQELTQHDSKLSFERWFELKSGDAYAGSPPVSLRVAASCTVPRQAPQVLSMVSAKPCSLKACLLPHSIKEDQNMSSWTRFVYDCGTELIRLQIREHKAKSGVALVRELVGVTKSSKQPLQLAEFTENKWSFNNSNSSITLDLKPSKDGCINELKYDNKLIKLYRGRRLAYELKCCSQHAEDTAAVTAVKFSAEHPYGKAVALVDTESEFISVDEDWFLLPWIAISFLFLNSIGKDGAKLIEGAMVPKAETVEPDTAVVSQTMKGGAAGAGAGPGQCGACGTAGSGDMVMASDNAGHASYGGSVIASTKVADSKCGGCGSGCGGGCGVPVVTMSYKKGHASCGVVAGGENGHVESAGCGSGCGSSCGGSMVVESSGCGGGGCCGSGCGGGCGSMVMEGSKIGFAKSGGCGSGCGGGCGSGCGGGCGNMVTEGPKSAFAKSGGCGSGCGGGCGSGCGAGRGGMVIEGPKSGFAKSGGCGSGCGGGCGGMVMEGSKTIHAQSGGCGSGCGSACGGGACGGMVIEGSKTSFAKSAGCGSGCGGGCGGMVMEGSKMSHAMSGGCGSGCGAGCGGMLNTAS